MRIPARYLLGGAGLYVGVAAVAYLRVKSHKCPGTCVNQPQPDGQAFNCLADTYDNQVGWDETLMGISLLRRWLMQQAQVSSHASLIIPLCYRYSQHLLTSAGRNPSSKRRHHGRSRRYLAHTAIHCLQGDVLEVSAGTGRNLRYYSKAASSVTLTDTSKHMLWHARQKHEKYHVNMPVSFCLADAQRMLSNNMTDDEVAKEASIHSSKVQQPDSTYQDKLQTFSPAQFDTVIDTFGLCSHADPVAALKVGWLTLTGLNNFAHVTVHAKYKGPVPQHVHQSAVIQSFM